jgi:hypothetical protein
MATFALIDSGNVVINAISERFAQRLFGHDYHKAIMPSERFKYLGTADEGGQKMRVLGVTSNPVTLRFGGSGTVFKTHPLVLQGLSQDINISGPFLSANGIDQLHSRGSLRVKGQLVPLLTYQNAKKTVQDSGNARAKEDFSKVHFLTLSAINTEAGVTQSASAGLTTPSSVYVAKNVTIPARSAAFVQLRVPDIEARRLDDGEGLVEVAPEFYSDSGKHLSMCPVLTTVVRTHEQGNCYSSVMNLSDEVIRVTEGQLYGHFYKKNEEYPELPLHSLNSIKNHKNQPDKSRAERVQ